MSESDWFIFGVLSAIAIALFFIWWQSRRIANQLRNSTTQQELNIQHDIRFARRSNWPIYIWFFIGSFAIIAALFVLPEKNGSGNSESVAIPVLSIFVTFLVAWQIWQTIAAREEIREMKDAAEIVEDRFDSLNRQLAEQRESIPHMIEATRLYSHAHTLRTVGEKDGINLREAYALYLEAIVEFLQSNPQDFVDRCLAGMVRCQTPNIGAFNYNLGYDTAFVERCNRNYEMLEGMFNRLTQEQREQIRRLREIRLKYHTTPNSTDQ